MNRWAAVALILLTQIAVGISAQGRLEPDESVFSSLLSEYYQGVRTVLLEGVPVGAAAVVVLPSFEAEWAVWSVREPKPSVCSRIASSPIWNGEKPGSPNVPERSPEPKCAAVSPAIAEDLDDLWVAMLRRVAYPRPSDTIGLDGTTYHFSILARGRRLAGQVWSPSRKSETGRLVAVAEALRGYTRAPSVDAAVALCERVAAVQVNGRRLTSRCSRRATPR
jgi:hypothetical protein